eukprot:XP_001696627.1 predicted protein [Chlamydomonas reinhardtii]
MPLSAVLSQVALRAELQRLRAAPQAWSQERVSVVVTVAPLLWHPPVHVPARHRMKTALPSTRQLAAMLHGFLHRLQSSGQQPVQAQLLWALQQAARDERADTDLGFQVHQFVRRLWSRTAPQMAWLVLRARQRVAGDANDGAAHPLVLQDLEAALQDLLAEEWQGWWWPGSWSAGTWLRVGAAVGLVGGAVAVALMPDGGGQRSGSVSGTALVPVGVSKR